MSENETNRGSILLHSKVLEIESHLSEDEVDLWALREHCLTPGGLMSDSIRKKAWPKLVGVDFLHDSFFSSVAKMDNEAVNNFDSQYKDKINVVNPSSKQLSAFKKHVMARCLDSRQIDLDIARCTWHLLTGSQRSRRRQMQNKHKKKIATLLKKKQRRLGNLINLVLIQSYATSLNDFDDNRLRYYQGYHDISCIFLSVLGGISSPHTNLKERKETQYSTDAPDLFEQSVAASKVAKAIGLDVPSRVLLQISQSHLKDAMKSNFEAITSALRMIIMPLICTLDKEVHDHLQFCGMEPFFCFSWIISWFSHDIRDTSIVKRLFDMFIVSHPLMPIYMSVAMVLHPCNREEVLNTECEFASLHQTLSQLPRNSCSVGWKFVGNQFGGGYVSGDEEDAKKISLETESLLSEDVDRDSVFDDEASTAPSLASESLYSTHDASRVPIQELIDLSIKFMRRIPPRNLQKLAQNYNDKSSVLMNISSINLFHDPPSWTIRSFAPSERAIKLFLKKKREIQGQAENQTTKPVTEKMYPRAAIACGFGPDGEREATRRLWKRKKLKLTAIAISICATTFGVTGYRSEQLLGLKIMLFSRRKLFINTLKILGIVEKEKETCTNPDYGLVLGPKLGENYLETESRDKYSLQNEHNWLQNDNQDNNLAGTSYSQSKKKKPQSMTKPDNFFSNFAKSAKRSLSDEAEAILL